LQVWFDAPLVHVLFESSHGILLGPILLVEIRNYITHLAHNKREDKASDDHIADYKADFTSGHGGHVAVTNSGDRGDGPVEGGDVENEEALVLH
jgi:hypothetical protein